MTIITTGVKSPNATLVERQEIRVFLQDKDVTNLYLLALERMQKADQQDPLSWFQLSGIHGRPYIPYDGVGSRGSFGGYCTHSSILFPTWHRPYLALFEQTLAKHVSDIANEFTNSADKQKYINAALKFRIPYWDWALDSDLPDIVSMQETVSVQTPGGPKTIKNPLYSYTFHPVYSDFGDGLPDERTWESWQSTLRWPTRGDASGRSQPQAMENQLKNNRLTLRDRTYNLLTQATNYAAFSNDGFLGPQSDPRFYDSLESIHGQIHGLTGRNGHMGVVDYAGFDPVFWLHHTNVDRLFAIWQALNPTSYVVPRENDAGTFTTRPGTVENAESPLTPFWEAQGKFWTSTRVRDTRTFNYTYPELTKWSTLSPEQKRVRLRSEVNRLYGKTAPVAAVQPGVFANFASAFSSATASVAAAAQKTAGAAQAAVAPQQQQPQAQKPLQQQPQQQKPAAAAGATSILGKAQDLASAAQTKIPAAATAAVTTASTAAHNVLHTVAGAANVKIPGHDHGPAAHPTPAVHASSQPHGDSPFTVTSSGSHEPHHDDRKHYHEWVANILVEKYAAKTTFFVHIFLGDFNADPKKWGTDPNLVGSHVIFANNLTFTGCEKCRDAHEQHKLVTGTIPLTGALGDRLGKDSISHLEPEKIIPYLQKNLHWRIQRHDDTAVERAEIPSLKISVGHASVAVPQTVAEFPSWGEIVTTLGVTQGRPGGAGS